MQENQTAESPTRGANLDVVVRALTRTRRRYGRMAPFYDATEILAERRYRAWRRRLWSRATAKEILEVGVGTGKNIPFYPPDSHVTAIDLTPGMLARAYRRAAKLERTVDLHLGDVQALDFPDDRFDCAVATFVFCSVPDPRLGLAELERVVRPDGLVLLLEHVRSDRPGVARLMDILNPLFVRATGANINRQTVKAVQQSRLIVEAAEDLGWGGIFKMIVARKEAP